MTNFGIMRVVVLILLFVFFGLIDQGCKKPHNNNITGGGKGGNGTISVSPEHFSSYLDSCRVYIKYATLDAPANNVYDDSVLPPLPYVSDTVPVAAFHNLKAGIYYVYAVGIHPGYSPPNVRGGKPVTLSTEDSEHIVVPTYSY